MTIVDSLKAKGSTGGNNIAEAIKNLPMGGSGGGGSVIEFYEMYADDSGYGVHGVTYGDIKNLLFQHKIPILFIKDVDIYNTPKLGSIWFYIVTEFVEETTYYGVTAANAGAGQTFHFLTESKESLDVELKVPLE